MPRRAHWIAVLFLTIGSAVASLPIMAKAGEGALDGRSFVVVVTDPSGDTSEDTLLFEDGLFRSVSGEKDGFGPVAYSTQYEWEDGLEFSAVAESAEAGTKRWYGMLEGDLLQGSIVWEEDGQDPGDYIFEGSERAGS